MNPRLFIFVFYILLTMGSVQAQQSWFIDFNTGLHWHKLSPSTSQNFISNLKNKGFARQPKTAVQFDLIAGRKGASGLHVGIGFKTLRLETEYSLTTIYEEAIGIQELTESVGYQNHLNFYQFRAGYDHHFSRDWMVGLRLSFGFDPSPAMFHLERRTEAYALFDQTNLFEQGQTMPKSDQSAYFGAIELATGKDFYYFSVFLYGRITWVSQKQDMRYPLALYDAPLRTLHAKGVNLRYQVQELGLSIRVPLWFIP